MIPFHIIVAVDLKNGIGKNGALPWTLPGDLQHFKDITTKTESEAAKNVVIMGRKTWDSIPEKFRPLRNRINCILTRNRDFSAPDDVLTAESLEAALELLFKKKTSIGSVFVIGGGEIFREAVELPECQRIYLTQILKDFNCDVFFPDFEKSFKNVAKSPHIKEGGVEYFFAEYHNI